MSAKMGNGDKAGGNGGKGGSNNDYQDFTFNPSDGDAPSLRKPQLSGAGLQAAIELGFDGTYVPSSVTGGDRNNFHLDNRSNNRHHSVTNNHSNNPASNSQQNQSPLFVDNYIEGLTELQRQGILPPLPRPDSNQLPPDVLAVLLKSPRFEQMYSPGQRSRHSEINPNSLHHQQRNQTQIVEQHTNYLENSQHTFGSREQTATSVASNLSPFAQEFYPTSLRMNSQAGQEQDDLVYALSQVQFQGQSEPFQLVEDVDGSDHSDRVLSSITDMISQVSLNPASLTRCTNACISVLKSHLHDEDTLGIAITLLTEQMISNENFCFSGAKILDMFYKNDIKVESKNIKSLLLTRMQEEHGHCVNNMHDPDVRARSLGVLRLLSDLYMNFGALQDNSKLNIIGLATLELMLKLLQNDKSGKAVTCVCQRLKLIGWDLDSTKANSKKIQEYMDKVFNELATIQKSSDTHSSTANCCDRIIKLRENKWDREQEDNVSSPRQSEALSEQSSHNSLYYELPDSIDELDFYEENDGEIMLDDEPEEVQAAYEEFLKGLSSN